MILVNWQGRDRTFKSVDELVVKLKVEVSTRQSIQLQRRSEKGLRSYIEVNPFDEEIHGKRSILLCDTLDVLNELARMLADEI